MLAHPSIWPRSFGYKPTSGTVDPYLSEPAAGRLAEFFWDKGLAALKDEDRREQWHQDWLDYQAGHQLYASVLSPRQYSSLGNQFNLLNLTRFLEIFAYFSPSHGYSLQVSFLGLFSILMGTNEALKREAVATLEAGGLLALGVSEKEHGSDLLANDFSVVQTGDGAAEPAGEFAANGGKYYIGNCNCAAMVSILARKLRRDQANPALPRPRAPLALIVVRPPKSPRYGKVRKIRTLGVRSAFVGEFEVNDHKLPAGDFVAEGRDAWDAVFGTVTLGKFFLGFGSVGMCEHAMEEALGHLRRRVLYRKPVLEMPHIRLAAAQAYARLAAMKLYAYRALDYVHAASATERRYLLFCAVQKAKVSTEGVKVMAQLSECIGAKGLESETYFESALRDTQLIPGLEGSTHINLGLTAQFAERYFERRRPAQTGESSRTGARISSGLSQPPSLARGDVLPDENPYLLQARGGALAEIPFAHFLDAYAPFKDVRNVRRFARQAKAFARLIRQRGRNMRAEAGGEAGNNAADFRVTLCLGQCLATIAYAQLIAENARLFRLSLPMISAMFHLLVSDLSSAGGTLAALPGLDKPTRSLALGLIAVPKTVNSDWEEVAGQFNSLEGG
jgi:acyl-CoA dehydrogenase